MDAVLGHTPPGQKAFYQINRQLRLGPNPKHLHPGPVSLSHQNQHFRSSNGVPAHRNYRGAPRDFPPARNANVGEELFDGL